MRLNAPISWAALYAARRHADAASAYALITARRFGSQAEMAACQAQLGNAAEAARHVAAAIELKPDISSAAYAATLPYQNEGDRAYLVEGLMKARLPA